MGCLFILLAALSPRLGIAVLWLFTNYVNLVFSTWIWPLLGLIALPWATLMYILVAAPAGGITFWGWLMVGLGLVLDIGSHAQTWNNREQAVSMVPGQQTAPTPTPSATTTPSTTTPSTTTPSTATPPPATTTPTTPPPPPPPPPPPT